jgi:hypothetical protein
MIKDAKFYVQYKTWSPGGCPSASALPRLSITAPALSSPVSFICLQRYVISGIDSVVK